jgi:hypothetical protein
MLVRGHDFSALAEAALTTAGARIRAEKEGRHRRSAKPREGIVEAPSQSPCRSLEMNRNESRTRNVAKKLGSGY